MPCIKHGVYPIVNAVCNRRINVLFTIHGMDETVFERVLRKARDRGWSQSDLAERLGLSPQNITNWKSRGIPPERYVGIADALSCSLDELLGRTRYVSGEEPVPRTWPYSELDERKFRTLDTRQAARLEGAILLAAAQLGLDVKRDA